MSSSRFINRIADHQGGLIYNLIGGDFEHVTLLVDDEANRAMNTQDAGDDDYHFMILFRDPSKPGYNGLWWLLRDDYRPLPSRSPDAGMILQPAWGVAYKKWNDLPDSFTPTDKAEQAMLEGVLRFHVDVKNAGNAFPWIDAVTWSVFPLTRELVNPRNRGGIGLEEIEDWRLRVWGKEDAKKVIDRKRGRV